ncbi:MAG: hypothetical protein M3348_16540, partial [Acidobacteriota bacterium]|nr:hypothetical protein [Acidobacteriota bacterium]
MPDSVAIELLKQIKSKKGCSIRELYRAAPEVYRYIDADPITILREPLLRLISWGLVEAYDESRLLELGEVAIDPYELRFKDFKFYISPLAVAMEDTLGFSFTGGSQSIS